MAYIYNVGAENGQRVAQWLTNAVMTAFCCATPQKIRGGTATMVAHLKNQDF